MKEGQHEIGGQSISPGALVFINSFGSFVFTLLFAREKTKQSTYIPSFSCSKHVTKIDVQVETNSEKIEKSDLNHPLDSVNYL